MNRGDRAQYNGYEVCLWMLDYLGITANPSAINHVITGITNSGLYDNGWYITQVRELYAPVSMRLIASYPSGTANGHTQLWTSLNPVWLPSYNTPQYISIGLSHSDNLIYTAIGTEITQGTHFYNTGTFGLSGGAHVHLILYVGARSTMFPTGYNSYIGGNIWYSDNPPNTIADMFYLSPTDIVRNDGGYTWTTYTGVISKGAILETILYMNLRKKRRAKHGKRIYT